jgi:hypothetical protein
MDVTSGDPCDCRRLGELTNASMLFNLIKIWDVLDEWIKKNVVYLHNGMLSSHKRMRSCHCDNIGGTGGHYGR